MNKRSKSRSDIARQGGRARARALSPAGRRHIAVKAAERRWEAVRLRTLIVENFRNVALLDALGPGARRRR